MYILSFFICFCDFIETSAYSFDGFIWLYIQIDDGVTIDYSFLATITNMGDHYWNQ